jgi:hypothetical protein
MAYGSGDFSDEGGQMSNSDDAPVVSGEDGGMDKDQRDVGISRAWSKLSIASRGGREGWLEAARASVSFRLRLACLIQCRGNSKKASVRCARARGVLRCQ